MRHPLFTAALGALACATTTLAGTLAAPALADDPRDPAMRNAEARARDAAEIRRLNREQAAMVARRDAQYAQGWEAWREARDGRADYEAARADYARDMESYARARRDHDANEAAYAAAPSDYEADMRAWRRDVEACRAGYREYCAR